MKKRAGDAPFFNRLAGWPAVVPRVFLRVASPVAGDAYHVTVPKRKPDLRPIERLRQTASGQDSQFATAQALHLGLTRDELKGMRRRGETFQLRRGVGRFSAAAGEPDPAITAVLTCWPVGVISHRSAAQHHGIARVAAPAEPEIIVPHGIVRKLPGIKVHWSRALEDQDILRVGEVSYTSLARTAIDLADPDDPWETLAILDAVVAMGAKRNWIYLRSKALANGRAGVTLLRDATSPDAVGAFNSWLERTAFHVYRAGGLPAAEWNVAVTTRGVASASSTHCGESGASSARRKVSGSTRPRPSDAATPSGSTACSMPDTKPGGSPGRTSSSAPSMSWVVCTEPCEPAVPTSTRRGSPG